MRRTRKGYKVVRVSPASISSINEVYLSATVDAKETVYKQHEFTKRLVDCGPLAVFDNVDHAVAFLLWCSRNRFYRGNIRWCVALFEVEYKPSKDQTLWYWKNSTKETAWFTMPNGTQYADEVKLVRPIKRA